MITGSHSWQCVKACVLHWAAGRGQGEPYVISHNVAEAASSEGTGRKSNNGSTVHHRHSWMTTSGRSGQPIAGSVSLSPPPG